MSMKIHDGHQLQLDTPTSIIDFFDAARAALNERFAYVRDSLLAALSTNYLDKPERAVQAHANHVEHLDKMDMLGDPTPLRLATRDLTCAHKTTMRNPLDLAFHLSITADVTRPETHALVWLAGRTDIYADVLAALRDDLYLGFSEYAYWNNTDRPDSVPSDVWDRRRDSWDKTLGYNPPSEVSLNWNVINDSDRMTFCFGGRYFWRDHTDELETRWSELQTSGPSSFTDAATTVLDVEPEV